MRAPIPTAATTTRRAQRHLLLVLLALAALALGACRGAPSRRPPIHLNPNMDIQPKYKAQSASSFFYNGGTMQPPVSGTVARGHLDQDRARHEGLDDFGEPVATSPIAVSDELIARGADRYQIYCRPCHGRDANGQGKVVERAKITSADLRVDPVSGYSDGRIFQIITDGKGLMPGYRHPVPDRDRWAIVAYLRTLQGGRR